jgi:hypothetical protein
VAGTARRPLGGLLAEAASTWAPSPFDVVLTFGKEPDGPWTLGK